MDDLLVDAVAYALSRKVVPSNEYYSEMTSIQRRQSVSIAGLAEVDQIQYIIDGVNKAMAEGKTFDEFKSSLSVDDLGLPAHRLRTIFQTNIQQAYAHGRWKQQQRDKKNKPYLTRVEINDSKTRPHHAIAPINGLTRPIDDPIWNSFYAPDEINCRGIMRGLTEEQAKQLGLTDDNDLPDESLSTGWGTPKDYAKRFDKLVAERILTTMLKHPKQAATIMKITDKIKTSADKLVAKASKSLKTLIRAAKKLIGDK